MAVVLMKNPKKVAVFTRTRTAALLVVFSASAVFTHLRLTTAFHDRMTSDRTERRRFDKPGQADKFFYEQRAYPSGIIPADWRRRAVDHIHSMKPYASLLKPAEFWSWVSIGPRNIAGRIRALAADPADFNTLYAGAAGGGIWKTTDMGRNWRALNDFLPNLRIGSIAVHPVRPGTVFAGNGEGFVLWQDALAYGRGIYRSDDAGESWRLIPATENANFEFVFDIAFDPFRPDVVLACTRVGVMRSSDGGETWTRLRITFSQIRGMMSVFSRTTEGLVYAAIEGAGIYRSSDHGVNWEGPLANGLLVSDYTRIQLAAAPSNGDVLYAAFTKRDESCAGVFRSADRGSNWNKTATPVSEIDGEDYMRFQGQYNSVLAVHPTNPDFVIAGGIDLYRTSNGGVSWKQITNWYPFAGYAYVHADQHAFLFNPRNASQVVAASDGGIFRSDNGGVTFLDANSGLVTVQFHSGTPHPSSDLVLGGTIDNGNLRVSSGASWTDVTGGDGGFTAIDYNDPRVMYSEIYYLDFYKSTASGAAGSWRSRMNGIPQDPEGGTSDRCAFIAPFEMDPANPKILYAGTYRLFRTANAADLWTPSSEDLSAGGFISAIGPGPSGSGVIYTGASTGAVYVTVNDGLDWTRSNAGLPKRYITDMALDRANPARAYLTVSGFGTGHVWKTTDHGATWSDASGTGPAALPDVPVNTIAVHPVVEGRLYIGTDAGVFISLDDGATWTVMNTGMGNVTVADLQFRRDGTLFAATHGRGAFKSSYSLLDTQRIPAAGEFKLYDLYPNPVNAVEGSTLAVKFEMLVGAAVKAEIFDVMGKRIKTFDLGFINSGEYRAALPAADLGTGIHYLRVEAGTSWSGLKKFVVLK